MRKVYYLINIMSSYINYYDIRHKVIPVRLSDNVRPELSLASMVVIILEPFCVMCWGHQGSFISNPYPK